MPSHASAPGGDLRCGAIFCGANGDDDLADVADGLDDGLASWKVTSTALMRFDSSLAMDSATRQSTSRAPPLSMVADVRLRRRGMEGVEEVAGERN
ncbi:hypothetical protein RHSIM_Rhsim02G0047500 [Rhododendron simsii]|uniref:Uncharacterized protein n=1 Tax=Rhododendron simsii TaxID=118357 RepID=A0A834LWF5_RHOSS|nr:hypothetical protein RHSIM_Rhsim02G0047500 [Rhododendron simsii]